MPQLTFLLTDSTPVKGPYKLAELMKMTESDAQKALDEFWEMVEKKYGPDRGRIDDGDRKKLFELEKQFDEARKSDAANN